MKSVRISLSFGAKKQCTVDCAAQGFESLTITLEDRDGRDDQRNGTIGETDWSADREANGVDPVHVPDSGRTLEIGDGAGLGSNYGRARTGVCGHGFPQDYQAKGGAFQQTYQARASGGDA